MELLWNWDTANNYVDTVQEKNLIQKALNVLQHPQSQAGI